MFSELNKILQNDGVIAFVTDTVWGIGCLPTSEKAVQRIYEIKKRESKKPLILMSYDTYPLLDYVKQPIEKQGQMLIKKYFPGALTLVLEKSEQTPDYITSNMNTVGIRVTDNETFARICKNNERQTPQAEPCFGQSRQAIYPNKYESLFPLLS